MAETKTVAEMLREKPEGRGLECWLAKSVLGLNCGDTLCALCYDKTANALANMIEAEQENLMEKCKHLYEDFYEPCAKMGFDKNAHGLEATYNAMYLMLQGKGCCIDFKALDLLCDKLDCGSPDMQGIAKQIRKAMNGAERTKTEHDGVDVDALLKVADELDIPKDSNGLYMDKASAHRKRDIIRNAVKGTKPQLPEGIEWPRFEDGELVKFGDKIQHDGEAKKVSKVSFYKTRTWIRAATETYYEDCEYLPNEPLKRPEPEVLDADNVPIKAGDTVYAHNAEPLTVRELTSKALTLIEDSNGILWEIRSDKLTYRKPDTFKSVVEEMLTDFDSHDTIELDGYFDRLRKLMGGE